MYSYIDAVRHVYTHGEECTNERTGTKTRSVSGLSIRHDSSESFAAITARKVSLRIAFEETMFFLRGEQNTKILEDKGIFIWQGNTTREFLDKRGLANLEVGDMGRGYGTQWRDFAGTDQISRLLRELQTNPTSRQHLVVAWNPAELHMMALPPCHFGFQVLIKNGRLDLIAYLRSNDLGYGTPYNLMGYCFIQNVLVKYLQDNGVEMRLGDLILHIGDAHIYENQYKGEHAFISPMIERYYEIQLRKEMHAPKAHLIINKTLNTVEDIMSLQWSDLDLVDYDPQPDYKNKPPMVA